MHNSKPSKWQRLLEFAAAVAVQTTGTVLGGLVLYVWLGQQ
ncbi:hypothetical protein [Streptomyces cinerochromogenes]